MFMFVSSLVAIIGVIISVVYFTMLERKVMSYMQLRKGPKKVGFIGLLTPVADAVKLLVKSLGKVISSKFFIFWFSPLIVALLMMFSWILFPFLGSNVMIYFGFLFFLCLSSMNVYGLLGSGWGSNSKYSLLGSIRGCAQTMSYEVSLVFLLMVPLILLNGYNMMKSLNKGFFFGCLFFLWMISCVAETNRAPFDFAEGESELVSGFNTEYGAMEFACLFLGEYGQIIFLSFVSILVWFVLPFFGTYILMLWLIVGGCLLALSYIWMRSTFPRFRYDLLMDFLWSLVLLFLMFGVCLIFVFS